MYDFFFFPPHNNEYAFILFLGWPRFWKKEQNEAGKCLALQAVV